jgi:hypothetical protein
MKKSVRVGLLALFAILVLVAAACGSETDDAASGGGGSNDAAVLPVNDGDDPAPAAAGACLEGEPDCNDTPGRTPQDLPLPSDVSVDVPSGMLIDGGLTIGQALAGDATGVIAVKGFLFIDETGARLCDLLAESFPPQCGGETLPISNFEEVLGTPLQSSQGISWTDIHVSFLGEIVDGVLVVDPAVSQ